MQFSNFCEMQIIDLLIIFLIFLLVNLTTVGVNDDSSSEETNSRSRSTSDRNK